MRTGLFVCLHSAQRLLRACGALRVGVGCVGSLAVHVCTAEAAYWPEVSLALS